LPRQFFRAQLRAYHVCLGKNTPLQPSLALLRRIFGGSEGHERTGSKPRLTREQAVGIVFDGVICFMGKTVRWGVLRRSVFIAFICSVFSQPATYGQTKDETTQQTNGRIQELANLRRSTSGDIPLGAGDLIHVEVFDVPELSRDARISVSGEIGFPLVHERIRAAGLTPFQLEQKIQELLIQNGLVSHPQVSVFVKEQNSQPVTIIGSVARPMTYQVLRPTTLLELIANAGGITDNAGTVILITRPTQKEFVKPVSDTSTGDSDSEAKTIRIQLQDLLSTGDTAFNIPVYGGDVVNVPAAGMVYALGRGIAQPGGYVLQSHGEQITVLKVVALAHGLGSFSKPNDAVIYRLNPKTGEREAIPVHIKQIEKNKSEDVAMKSNDILYVPDNLGLKIAVRGIESAISIGSGLLIYRSTNSNP
jgi:polysaccharide export outer membrane protein